MHTGTPGHSPVVPNSDTVIISSHTDGHTACQSSLLLSSVCNSHQHDEHACKTQCWSLHLHLCTDCSHQLLSVRAMLRSAQQLASAHVLLDAASASRTRCTHQRSATRQHLLMPSNQHMPLTVSLLLALLTIAATKAHVLPPSYHKPSVLYTPLRSRCCLLPLQRVDEPVEVCAQLPGRREAHVPRHAHPVLQVLGRWHHWGAAVLQP